MSFLISEPFGCCVTVSIYGFHDSIFVTVVEYGTYSFCEMDRDKRMSIRNFKLGWTTILDKYLGSTKVGLVLRCGWLPLMLGVGWNVVRHLVHPRVPMTWMSVRDTQQTVTPRRARTIWPGFDWRRIRRRSNRPSDVHLRQTNL